MQANPSNKTESLSIPAVVSRSLEAYLNFYSDPFLAKMASSAALHRPPPSNEDRFVAANHGNCSFSDANSPVVIKHFANGAVVSPAEGTDTGVIHFAIPLALESGIERSNQLITISRLQALEVDFVQVAGSEQQTDQIPSEVTEAEIYVGCDRYWSSEVDERQSFAVQLKLKDVIGMLDLRRPKGFGVTLHIRFGNTDLRFCSVAVIGSMLKNLGNVVKPDEK